MSENHPPKHLALGKRGEDIAAQYLLSKGYEVLERNYKVKRAEIDMIAKLKEVIVFVEVKTRTSTDFGFPEEFVSQRQQQQIAKAAEFYLYKEKLENYIRFDIIAITMIGKEADIEHFEDAFY